MAEATFDFSSSARYEMYLENKRVERCMRRRLNSLERLAKGEITFTPEQLEQHEAMQTRLATFVDKWLD
ncbi:MAG: hypothetical protein DI585_06975 [Pseudomonas fluorescens]|nr:MAG: hypothetical protein DI585_06975 [Pseudomonas fluorescens]